MAPGDQSRRDRTAGVGEGFRVSVEGSVSGWLLRRASRCCDRGSDSSEGARNTNSPRLAQRAAATEAVAAAAVAAAAWDESGCLRPENKLHAA